MLFNLDCRGIFEKKVVQKLSQKKKESSLKVVSLMNSQLEDKEEAFCVERGIDEFVKKPFSLDILKTTVKKMMQG